MEHPLKQLIKLRKQAIKSKAHPKLLANIEKRIEVVAAEVRARLLPMILDLGKGEKKWLSLK